MQVTSRPTSLYPHQDHPSTACHQGLLPSNICVSFASLSFRRVAGKCLVAARGPSGRSRSNPSPWLIGVSKLRTTSSTTSSTQQARSLLGALLPILKPPPRVSHLLHHSPRQHSVPSTRMCIAPCHSFHLLTTSRVHRDPMRGQLVCTSTCLCSRDPGTCYRRARISARIKSCRLMFARMQRGGL